MTAMFKSFMSALSRKVEEGGEKEGGESRGRPGIKKQAPGGGEIKKPSTPRKKAQKRTSPTKSRISALKGMSPSHTKKMSPEQKKLMEKSFEMTLPAGLRWRHKTFGPNTRSINDVKFDRLRSKGEAFKAKRKGQDQVMRRQNAELAFAPIPTAGQRYHEKHLGGATTKSINEMKFSKLPTKAEAFRRRTVMQDLQGRKSVEATRFAQLPTKAEVYRRKIYGPYKTLSLGEVGSFAKLPTKGEVFARKVIENAKLWAASEERPVNIMAGKRFKTLPTAAERYMRKHFGPGVQSAREMGFKRMPTKGEQYCKKIGMTDQRETMGAGKENRMSRRRAMERIFPVSKAEGYWRKNKFVPFAG